MSRRPAVIAHRGASGYLPEHTFAAKAMAHAMGADFLEQDVIGTRDGELIVFHDLHLDQLTDVGQRFPGRSRSDGLHYCIDFTLTELRSLRVTERRRKGTDTARFPGRFPVNTGSFRIHTLAEELEFIRGLNRSTGRTAGVYTEIKDPGWHARHAFPLGDRVVETLADFGYQSADDGFFVQCFDPVELLRVRGKFGSAVPLIQLLDDGAPLTPEALSAVATCAQGLGPPLGMVWPDTGLVARARGLGLLVHPYTFRVDELPAGCASPSELLDALFGSLQVDGVFADFPDVVVQHLAAGA